MEKALGKNDFAAQKGPLENIFKALRAQRLSSIEQLDLGTRGKLITSLMRVTRQPRPPQPTSPEGAKPAEAGEEAKPAEAGEEAKPAEAGEEAKPAEASEGAKPAEAGPPAAQAKSPEQEKWDAYAEAIYLVGKIWRAVGEVERAGAAFQLSGRSAPERDEEPEPRPRAAEPQPPREGRERKPRQEGGREHRVRERRVREHAPLPSSGDWRKDARDLEEAGRTRDAGKIHERHQSHAEAARLFEIGRDQKGALRNFLLAGDRENGKRLLGALSPADAIPEVERAGAHELLMELYIQKNDFENVARLYERARQYDQAGLAYERASRFSLARKAYERARDTSAVARVRELEVRQLLAKGDRLAAATLLSAAGERERALEALKDLPPPKAYGFMMRAGLAEEAQKMADAELARADAEGKLDQRAKWLDIIGKTREAAETWEKAERPGRASHLYEKMGELARAAQLAEAAQEHRRAAVLFDKLGDAAATERNRALAAERKEPAPNQAAPVAEGSVGPQPGSEAPEPAATGQESQ